MTEMPDIPVRHLADGGRCKHQAATVHDIDGKPVDPFVMLFNDQDDYYIQVFNSAAELDAFIGRLVAARREAWPEET